MAGTKTLVIMAFWHTQRQIRREQRLVEWVSLYSSTGRVRRVETLSIDTAAGTETRRSHYRRELLYLHSTDITKGRRLRCPPAPACLPSGERVLQLQRRVRFLVVGHEDLQILDVHLAVAPAPPRTRR